MLKKINKYLIIVLGTFLFAISVNMFTLPSKIVTGGFSGIATILFHLFEIPAGIVVGVLNLIVVLVALKALGKKFVVDSLLGIILIPLFIQLTSYFPPITYDKFLASVFGGILCGIGVGLAFSQGGTTGGTDIVSRISQKSFPYISIGKLLTAIDLVIITVSAFAFKSIELALYGIISLFISTAIIDMIISKLNSAKLVLIISKQSDNIEKGVLNILKRGLTTIKGSGGFSKAEKNILLCVMKSKEIEILKKIITQIDENAFIVVNESKEVLGEGFKYYR